MARNCPDCSMEMYIETVNGVQLDICAACAGTWFDAHELRQLLARDPLALSVVEDMAVPAIEQKAAGPSLRRCPDCEMPLEQYHYLYNSPVVLDTCTDCGGFWVQDGELAGMQKWLDQTNKPSPLAEEASLTIAQASIEHGKKMQQQNKLLNLFNMLRQHRPGWIVP